MKAKCEINLRGWNGIAHQLGFIVVACSGKKIVI